MKKTIYFVAGSQGLYGKETLERVDKDSAEIASFLSGGIAAAEIKYYGVATDSGQILKMAREANFDGDCIGVIVWCHTFSPAKMWIKGLKTLQKPMLHLHTQYNEKLPYDTIDMDFMNLNQAAHGDREFGFICARLGLNNAVVTGYYRHKRVVGEIARWAGAAAAYDYSFNLKVARFGDNMREVAVTEGNKVSAQIQFGWEVNTYGTGALVEEIAKVTDNDAECLLKEYSRLYTFKTGDTAAVAEQAKYEIAMKRFFAERGVGAFTNTFEDLYGMKQLPGLATQRLMAEGIGFGAEGDWKTACLGAVMMKMAEGVGRCAESGGTGKAAGATGFMEDYTYDLTEGGELVLGAHMLEVPLAFAATKPAVEVHPLGIGGKEPPARLVFDGVCGKGIAVSLVDMGGRFKLSAANIELVPQPKAMPRLPVARVMWKILPDHASGVSRWIREGGAHHTVVSTALSAADMKTLADLWKIDCIVIG
ncbi:MAG: L-arabinose isomerase [Clostridiales bacterium]|jgi:L-arabinose isomerase|nr:L-arabinose isomerase [Clostridiales bacterium]